MQLKLSMSDARLAARLARRPSLIHFCSLPPNDIKSNYDICNTECPYVPGVHYWYDISLEMHCDQVQPVFLLYDQASQRLKAFGWATLANITSSFWEHPPTQFLQVSNLLLNNK